MTFALITTICHLHAYLDPIGQHRGFLSANQECTSGHHFTSGSERGATATGKGGCEDGRPRDSTQEEPKIGENATPSEGVRQVTSRSRRLLG